MMLAVMVACSATKSGTVWLFAVGLVYPFEIFGPLTALSKFRPSVTPVHPLFAVVGAPFAAIVTPAAPLSMTMYSRWAGPVTILSGWDMEEEPPPRMIGIKTSGFW